jgi:GTPase involved in cell partitioning and DNA repair
MAVPKCKVCGKDLTHMEGMYYFTHNHCERKAYNEYESLQDELARYKQEAEKIPQMCNRNRLDACQVCSRCPQICPKYKE